MSQANPAPTIREAAERLVAALNARDFEAITELPTWDPEMEFRSALALAEGETYVGIDGIRRWAENADATWADFRVELADFRALSDDRILVIYHVTARARTSGVPLDSHTAQVWTMRQGKTQRIDSYTDPSDAFEAVGLRE